MSDVPGEGGAVPARDDISESSGDVELSDPGSETSSLLEEEVHAADHTAEEEFRDAQENYSTVSEIDPHSEYHAAEEAYFSSGRPQTSASEQAQSDFASAADILDDSEMEHVAEHRTESPAPAPAGNGNGNGDADHDTASDTAGDHEQTPAVPALTAEPQDNAALPSIEAVTASEPDTSAAASSPKHQQQQEADSDAEPASSQHDQASEHDSDADDQETAEPAEYAPLPRLPSMPQYRESEAEQELETEQPAPEPVAEEEQQQTTVTETQEQQPEEQDDQPAESAPRPKLVSLQNYAKSSDDDEQEEQLEQQAEQPSRPGDFSPEVQDVERLMQQAMAQASASGTPSEDAPAHAQQAQQDTVSASVKDEPAATELSAHATQFQHDSDSTSEDDEHASAESPRQSQLATSSTAQEDQPAATEAPTHTQQSEEATVSTSAEDAPVSVATPASSTAEDAPVSVDAPAASTTEAASVSERTSEASSERQPRGLSKLPSLPPRRGAPSLPARPSAGSSATQAASRPQEAIPSTPGASDNPPASAPKPPTSIAAVANNGHSQAAPDTPAATAGNGVTTASIRNAGNEPSAAQQQPSAASQPGAAPSDAAAAARAAAGANAGAAAGRAGPRLAPRQPTGNGQAGPAAAAPAPAPAPAAAPPAAEPERVQPAEEENEEHREMRNKVQKFRVLLVRLALRLQTPVRSSIVQQVNYRLDLAERIRLSGNRGGQLDTSQVGFEAACAAAQRLEEGNSEESLAFTCTVMVIGMSGVGKSATINSILCKDNAAPINAYKPGTHGVREVTGDVHGVKVRFIDTPGLQPGAALTGKNARLLNQMHAAFKKYKPDIMLYIDRADVFRTDQADVPLLRAITESFGPSTWFNTIVALTHAAVAPPDGNAGPISYDTYTRSRTQLLQQNIRQASGDMRLLNPVALVENHPNCRRNAQGLAVLPNTQPWKQHLTLLLLSSKLLADTDGLLKIQQDSSAHDAQRRAMRMLLAGRKSPPIPYLIAGFIQKKSPRKPPDEERTFRHDAELKDISVHDRKEEMRRRREYSRMRSDEAKAEAGATQAGVPAPDIPLQPTFDGEDTTHRFRYMEPGPDAALCRPVVDPNGLDHDDGMTAFTVEKSSVIRKRGVYVGGAPAYVMAQIHKDKDAFNIISEAEASYYYTHKMISTASLESQTVQADALFTTKLETRYKMHPKNKTAVGILLSRLKEDGGLPTKGPVVYGGKLENRYKQSDKLKVVLATATLMNKPEQHTRKDQAWNHSAEVRFKALEDDKMLVSLSGNNMRYHGKSGYGGGASVQYSHSQDTTAATSLQLNSERTGKVSVRVTSHDHPKLGFSLLVPVLGMIWGKIRGRD